MACSYCLELDRYKGDLGTIKIIAADMIHGKAQIISKKRQPSYLFSKIKASHTTNSSPNMKLVQLIAITHPRNLVGDTSVVYENIGGMDSPIPNPTRLLNNTSCQ